MALPNAHCLDAPAAPEAQQFAAQAEAEARQRAEQQAKAKDHPKMAGGRGLPAPPPPSQLRADMGSVTGRPIGGQRREVCCRRPDFRSDTGATGSEFDETWCHGS